MHAEVGITMFKWTTILNGLYPKREEGKVDEQKKVNPQEGINRSLL